MPKTTSSKKPAVTVSGPRPVLAYLVILFAGVALTAVMLRAMEIDNDTTQKQEDQRLMDSILEPAKESASPKASDDASAFNKTSADSELAASDLGSLDAGGDLSDEVLGL